MDASQPVDRRAALKLRHRETILAAAAALVEDVDGRRFSVDELAERADVARRTVFNHFASVDEILLALCDQALEAILDDFVAGVAAGPGGNGDLSSLFDDIAHSLRSTDLPAAIQRIVRIVGSASSPSADRDLGMRAFTRMADRLLREAERRNPDVDVLEAELLVGSLMNGVILVSNHWIAKGIRLDPDGRRDWDRLLERVITRVRTGYPYSY